MQGMRNLLATGLVAVGAAAGAQQLPPVVYENGRPQCPIDRDIKNLETRLNARVVPPPNAQSVQFERDKAIQCRLQGARYSDAEFTRMEAVTRGDK